PYLTSEVSFNAVAGELYHIAVDGFNGAEGYVLLGWSVLSSEIARPRIVEAPLPFVGMVGMPHEFSVIAQSPDGRQLGYQWFFNGVIAPGATNPAFRLAQLTTNDVGTYRVVVQNGIETGRSDLPSATLRAQLQLTTDPALVGNVPSADDKLARTNATPGVLKIGLKPIQHLATVTRGYSGAQVFSTTDAVKDPSEPQHCGVAGGASSWWLYTPPASGAVRVTTVGSSFDTVLAVYTVDALNFESLVSVTCDNDSGPNKTSVATFQAQANTTYFVVVDGVNGASGRVNLTYDLADAPRIVEQPGAGALDRVGEIQALARSVPVIRNVAEGSTVALRVVATNLVGQAPLAYQWHVNGVVIPGATQPTYTISNITAARAGDYQVQVSNFAGAVNSQVVRLAINVPPTIQTAPTDVTVAAGASATFTVVANGSGPLQYQWRLNDTILPSATNTTLVINNAQAQSAGRYTVEVSNSAGTRTAAANLNVLGPPVITKQPSGGAIIEGGSVNLTVEASGSQPLAYQWRFKGVNIPGANSATLTLNNVQPTSAGDYSVVVGNVVRSVVSDTVQLTVSIPVSIAEQPQSLTVLQNQNAGFTVNARGSAPVSYQWLHNGAPLPGQTSAALSLTRVQAAQGGQYQVVVSNAVNVVTSAAATLTVSVPPAITQQPTNLTHRVGETAVFSVVATGSAPLRYQWRFNGADIQGATEAALSLSNISAAAAGAYSVAVTGSGVTVVSQNALLTVIEAPTITLQPESKSALAGSTVTLSVGASGPGTLTYQWLKDGAVISGQVSSNLLLINLQPSAAGNYQALVSNASGVSTSVVAVVRALVAPVITQQPQNTRISAGANGSLTVAATGSDPLRYQWRMNGAAILNATNATLAFTPATSINSGVYSVLVSNDAGALSSSSATLTVVETPSIVQQPQTRAVTAGSSASFAVSAIGAPPLSYQWFHNNVAINGATSANLALNNVQQAQLGAYTVRVSNSAGSILSEVATLSLQQSGPTIRTTDAAFLANGSFRLKLLGPTTGSYQLLGSADLKAWDLITTFTFVDGRFQFDDTSAAARSSRYYRVVPAP
ncbi:MAG TPA: immunoglobulin domain-containing protein, partial [Methylomirabilota bacterium]|nr:immunoglobulin domain-containing protein [Methylomirabilota bacterium]